jgi:hypothetical protein
MNNKSKWQTIKSTWKIIVGLSVILGIITSLLQISGTVDFWGLLVLPLNAFLITEIPIYYAVLFVTTCVMLYYFVRRLRNKYKSCILDLNYGRKIALLCQIPRTTDFLRQQYNYWESQSSVTVIGGYGFDDYMKRLEKESFLVYANGKWQVTIKALEYISKYHGG